MVDPLACVDAFLFQPTLRKTFSFRESTRSSPVDLFFGTRFCWLISVMFRCGSEERNKIFPTLSTNLRWSSRSRDRISRCPSKISNYFRGVSRNLPKWSVRGWGNCCLCSFEESIGAKGTSARLVKDESSAKRNSISDLQRCQLPRIHPWSEVSGKSDRYTCAILVVIRRNSSCDSDWVEISGWLLISHRPSRKKRLPHHTEYDRDNSDRQTRRYDCCSWISYRTTKNGSCEMKIWSVCRILNVGWVRDNQDQAVGLTENDKRRDSDRLIQRTRIKREHERHWIELHGRFTGAIQRLSKQRTI